MLDKKDREFKYPQNQASSSLAADGGEEEDPKLMSYGLHGPRFQLTRFIKILVDSFHTIY